MAAGAGWNPASLQQLLSNETKVFLHAAKVLMRYAENILSYPHEEKYRRLSVANKRIQQFLLPAYGAIECLFEMGFVEDGEYFVLPATTPLDNLKKMHSVLKLHFSETVHEPDIENTSMVGMTRGVAGQHLIQQSEHEFYVTLLSSIRQVAYYLTPSAQEKARASMPLKRLRDQAAERLQKLSGKDCSIDDLLLIELLTWFKESFFRWMDSPMCSTCGGAMEMIGHVAPLAEESLYLVSRVEHYRCLSSSCGTLTRFPRYNDPCRLLETRVGRCGEWANCFTLLCLSAGLEARYVVDWTDHVWTEVYSTAQKRWLHADPCENVCDRPLLYEAGWGKKLTYVIAFSPYDIQDVTWRYTTRPAEVLSRRTLCREMWLVGTIIALRTSIQKERYSKGQLTDAQLQLLMHRTAAELVELMNENKSDAGSLGGRTTGSEDWRRARGELGCGVSTDFKPYSVAPTAAEIGSGVLEIKYSCARDEYTRVSDNYNKISGWQSLAFEVSSVFRKEELDWKMVYLARKAGVEVGSIAWKFQLAPHGLSADKLEITVDSKCYENGQVRWMVCASDQCTIVQPGKLQVVEAVRGCTEIIVKAILTGGRGENAWQHAQLFRQSLADADAYPFHLKLCLAKHKVDK